METARTYGRALDLVEKNWGTGLYMLVAEHWNESQRMIGEFYLLRFREGGDLGMNIRWDHFVDQYDTSDAICA